MKNSNAKRFLSTLLAVIMLLSSIAVSAYAVDLSGYTAISDKYEFAAIADNPNGKYYLADDIVFNESDFSYGGAFFNNGYGFNAPTSFVGVLDGCGHSIIGLFGDFGIAAENKGIIKNITFKDCYFERSNESNRTIASSAICQENSNEITNCKLENSSASYMVENNNAELSFCFGKDNEYLGICRTNLGNISNCINYSNISDNTGEEIGAIAAYNSGEISNCVNKGNITASYRAGGICGFNYGTSLTNCANYGSITASRSGGICQESHSCTLSNCINYGTVYSSTKRTDIIWGPTYWSSGISELKYNAIATNCINLGKINSGNGAAISVIGDYESGKTTKCYYLENSGQLNRKDSGITMLASGTVSSSASYTSFDFSSIWQIENSKPQLRIENSSYTGASIFSMPNKIFYEIGDEFDETGLQVILYDNLGNWEMTEDYNVSGYTGKFGYNRIKVITNGFDNQFTVTVQDKIENCTVAPIEPILETGKKIEVIPTLTSSRGEKLAYGTDFELSYKNNINIGLATVTVTGKGLYKGSVDIKFLIVPEQRLEVVNPPSKYYYSYGESLDTDGLTVREFKDDGLWHIISDYTLSGFTGSLGINTVTVSSDGFSNQFEVLVQEYIYNTNIKIASEIQTATGQALEPDPTITFNGIHLEKNKDYSCIYLNNTLPGKASVLITGKNNFKDNATVNFIIKPMKLTDLKTIMTDKSSISMSWQTQKGVDGYIVEKYDSVKKEYIEYARINSGNITVTGLATNTEYTFRVCSYKIIDGIIFCGEYSNLLYAKTIEAIRFPDVSKGAWYYDSVMYCANKGFISGYQNGNFGPNDKLKRQDFVCILARIAGADLTKYSKQTSKLNDVKKGAYYAAAVNWAVDNGIIAGYANGNFGVNDPITREQVATILYRYMGSPYVSGANSTLSKFKDVNRISSFAKTPVAWAVQEGIISGMADGRVAPTEGASRAQIASIIQRMDSQGMFD